MEAVASLVVQDRIPADELSEKIQEVAGLTGISKDVLREAANNICQRWGLDVVQPPSMASELSSWMLANGWIQGKGFFRWSFSKQVNPQTEVIVTEFHDSVELERVSWDSTHDNENASGRIVVEVAVKGDERSKIARKVADLLAAQ